MSFLPLILYMGGKWCITMSFSTIYIYTAELFPTNLRHSLLGICSMTGRMGSILSPQTPLLVSRLPQECTSWRPIRTACWLFAYYFKQYGKDSPICFYIPFIFCVTFFYVALWNRYIDCWLIIIRSGDIIFFIFQSKYYIVHDSVSKNNCYRIVSFFFWSIHTAIFMSHRHNLCPNYHWYSLGVWHYPRDYSLCSSRKRWGRNFRIRCGRQRISVKSSRSRNCRICHLRSGRIYRDEL